MGYLARVTTGALAGVLASRGWCALRARPRLELATSPAAAEPPAPPEPPVVYTNIMGLAAGTALVLVPMLGADLRQGRAGARTLTGWSLAFASTGAILTTLGLHTTTTWPIRQPPAETVKNPMFGEPAAAFGTLLLSAALYLWRRGGHLLSRPDPIAHLYAVARPPAVPVFGLGLGVLSITAGAVRHQLFTTAPAEEPLYGSRPALTQAVFSGLYGLAGAAATIGPVGVWRRDRRLLAASGALCAVAGVGWTLVSALSYYVHIGLEAARQPPAGGRSR